MEVIEGTNNAVEYLCNNKTNITIFIALIIAVFKITLEVIKFRSSLNDSKQKSDKIKSNIEIARYQVSQKDIIRDKKNQVASLQAALKNGVGTSKKSISVIQSAIEQVLPEFTFGGPLPEGEGAAEKISVGVIYVRDSADVKGAKELITIDPSTGTLKVLKTIF